MQVLKDERLLKKKKKLNFASPWNNIYTRILYITRLSGTLLSPASSCFLFFYFITFKTVEKFNKNYSQ